MSRRKGYTQKPTLHKVERPVSPDDIRTRMMEAQQRRAKDTRTPAQVWLGDPEPERSALAMKQSQQPVLNAYTRLQAWQKPCEALSRDIVRRSRSRRA